MGNGNSPRGTKNPLWLELLKVIGTLLVGSGIITATVTFYYKKEKEASDRLLHIITLLDSKYCKTVRAGAVTTMGVYLEGYKQYQNRAYWVMASNLATEEDPLVRDNILNILKGAKANAIEPLACMNRFLLEDEMRRQSSLLFSIGLAFRSDLDNGCISKELRQEFENNGERLPENAAVVIAEKGSRWLISNKDNEQKYSVRKEEDNLNICNKDNLTDPLPLPTINHFSLARSNHNLSDVTKALVAVLEKKSLPEEEKLYLSEIVLSNFDSPFKTNLDKTNLNQADLSRALLEGVSLKQADLIQADLEGAVLHQVDLTGAKLKGANLDSVKLRGDTILRDADLTSMLLFSIKAKKFQSDLDKEMISKDLQQEFEDNEIYLSQDATVSIEENDTKYIIFDDGKRKFRISKEQKKLNICSDTTLRNASLESADLRGAYFTNANMDSANLMNADMDGARISAAILTDANLVDANLANTDFGTAFLEGANLKRANISGANLEFAQLTGANLEGANLTDANLANADLEGANLKDANLTDANLPNAKFAGGDLSGSNLEGADLQNANLKAKVLFSVDPKKFQSDLDKGTISEDLQQEFEDNGIYLSKNTTVSIEEKSCIWLINDKGNKQTYTVRKEEWLNICKETKFDFKGIKQASNWKKAIFDNDVKQKLLSSQD